VSESVEHETETSEAAKNAACLKPRPFVVRNVHGDHGIADHEETGGTRGYDEAEIHLHTFRRALVEHQEEPRDDEATDDRRDDVPPEAVVTV
jgi:hypothetical protein